MHDAVNHFLQHKENVAHEETLTRKTYHVYFRSCDRLPGDFGHNVDLEAVRDDDGVKYMMGHTNPAMVAVYNQRIFENRLKTVSEYVNPWLLGAGRVGRSATVR